MGHFKDFSHHNCLFFITKAFSYFLRLKELLKDTLSGSGSSYKLGSEPPAEMAIKILDNLILGEEVSAVFELQV